MKTITIPWERAAMIQWRGNHKDIAYAIQQHSFRDDEERWGLGPCSWCTYVYLNEEMYEKVKDRINDAPWNGGQTYYRKITEEHIDVSPELKAKWDKPYFKIGDDFQHLWDAERADLFSREYMENHIKRVIDYLLDSDMEDCK